MVSGFDRRMDTADRFAGIVGVRPLLETTVHLSKDLWAAYDRNQLRGRRGCAA